MKERIASSLLSLNGLAIALGALGFLSGITQLFLDTSEQLSVKWLIFVVWIALSVMLIFLKIIYDLSNERALTAPFEVPIRFIENERIFVIRRNEHFLNNIVVGCYVQHDGVDKHACVGVVHIVQEHIIQIRVIGSAGISPPPVAPDALARIIIRPVVPFDALSQVSSEVTENE